MYIAVTVDGADDGKSGLSTYIRELYRALLTTFSDLRVTFFGPKSMTEWLDVGGGSRVEFVPMPDGVSGRTQSVAWHQTAWVRDLLLRHKPDVVHFPVANRRLAVVPGVPTVGTVHDLAELRGVRGYGLARNLYLRGVVVPLLTSLNKVITISQWTADDLRGALGPLTPRTTVIYQGLDHTRFFPMDKTWARAQVAQQFGISEPFVFFPSRIEHPAKNHHRLLETFMVVRRRLGDKHRLVLSGAIWPGSESVIAAINGYKPAVCYLGHVPQNWLAVLYAAAECMVFPSLYEGFGLPLLEAMACRTPVVSSTGGALPEVAGDAALLVDPLDTGVMADVLCQVLTEPDVAAGLAERGLQRAVGFTWEKTAAETYAVFRAAMNT